MSSRLRHARLFVGALVQWSVTGALTILLARGSLAPAVAAAFSMQILWWFNIHNAVRDRSWSHGIAWSTGAALGAGLSIILTFK